MDDKLYSELSILWFNLMVIKVYRNGLMVIKRTIKSSNRSSRLSNLCLWYSRSDRQFNKYIQRRKKMSRNLSFY